MNRITITALLLLAFVFFLAACNSDPVTGLSTGDPMIDEASKLNIDALEVWQPPEGYDPYYNRLHLNFSSVQWIEIPVSMNFMDNNEQMFSIPDHENYSIMISFEADPELLIDDYEQEGIIWIPAQPSRGQYLDIVGDCIIYRTKNIPPVGITRATIVLPIMPWFKTDQYDGQFCSYDLGMNEFGYPAPFNHLGVAIDWPPANPDGMSYITIEVEDLFGKDDDPSNVLDRVIDPVLGNEYFGCISQP